MAGTVKSELKKYMKAFGVGAAKEASRLIAERADIGLARYYADYTPSYYVRTGQFGSKSYKRYSSKGTGQSGIYEGGIRFIADDIAYPNAGLSAYSIVKQSLQGYHGWELVGMTYRESGIDNRHWRRIQTPSPLDYTGRYVRTKELKQKAISAGLKKAKSEEYKVINSIIDQIKLSLQ